MLLNGELEKKDEDGTEEDDVKDRFLCNNNKFIFIYVSNNFMCTSIILLNKTKNVKSFYYKKYIDTNCKVKVEKIMVITFKYLQN